MPLLSVVLVFQEIELENTTHFAVITPATAAPVVISLVLTHLERQLEDTEWVINRVRGEVGIPESDGGEICIY